MRQTAIQNCLLWMIAVALIAIAARPYLQGMRVRAQATEPHPFYIEPGTYLLRAPDGSKQVYGKIVVDLRSGAIWGFPTTTQDPYPVNPLNSKPQTSHPFALGRFAFEDTNK